MMDHIERGFAFTGRIELYIRSMIWRELDDFSSGSVCLAVVSDFFDESDYYRHYEEFLSKVRGAR